MQLEHEFKVDAPIDEVWQALQDPERIAPCLPGATLLDVDGDTLTAKVKVKLGPVTMQYKGTGEFLEKDEPAHKLVIRASGKDVRGAGTASVTSTLTLTGDGKHTTGSVTSEVDVTGRPAQFGRGMISDVGGKLMSEFATNLAEELAPKRATTDSATANAGAESANAPKKATAESAHRAVRPPEQGSINLMGVASAPVLKRLAPIVAVAVVLALIGITVRSCGKR